MGYIGVNLRLKNKGQAMVETMLLIALLVPILIYSVNTIRTKLGGALTGFLTNEIGTQARYGYSYQEMQNVAGGFDVSALSNTEGTMPIPMSLTQQGVVLHPVQRVQRGWIQ